MCVLQNWTNLEKHSPISQFSSKLSDFFLKDLTNWVLFYKLKALKSIFFWLGWDDLFQRPLGPISIILNFLKKFLQKLFYHIVPSLGKFNDSCSQNSLSHISQSQHTYHVYVESHRDKAKIDQLFIFISSFLSASTQALRFQ